MANRTQTEQWFIDNVTENEAELIEIGELANRAIHETISLGLANPKTTIACYGTIFTSICSEIAKLQAQDYSDFCLNIADRVRIGFTTTDSEDDEKQGNFMVFIQNVDCVTDDEMDDEDEGECNTITLCTHWNAKNITSQTDFIRDIAAKAKIALDKLINLKTESSEFIMPMFCIIHSKILNYALLKRKESDELEYEINVAGLYTLKIEVTNDGEEEISYIPSIALKLLFKNDAIATGNNED